MMDNMSLTARPLLRISFNGTVPPGKAGANNAGDTKMKSKGKKGGGKKKC